MSSNTAGLICAAVSLGVALVVGIFAAAMLWILGGWSFLQVAFAGIVIFVVLGALILLTVCRPSTGPVRPGSAGVKPGSAPTVPVLPERKSSRPAVKAAPTAAAAPAPAAKPAPAAAPAAEPTPAATAAPAPAADAAPAAAEGTRPAVLDGPREGGADDLKRIKGIGPKLEKLCNSLGFYHFDQIASWTPAEVAWVDENLEGFKGRVSRDTWVEQARVLAAGGDTEFSRKVDKGDVY